MRTKRDALSHDRLKELLHYDPDTGVFTRKITVGYQGKAGDPAGYMAHSGYLAIGIDRVRYYCHRLAWFYVHGEFPTWHIDHVNGITHDNRIINLRPASSSENISNGRHRVNNTSGVKGLRWIPRIGKWTGYVKHNYVGYYTGYYADIDLAKAALRSLRETLHKEFTNHG